MLLPLELYVFHLARLFSKKAAGVPEMAEKILHVFHKNSKSDPVLLFWRCELNIAKHFELRAPLEYLRGVAYNYDIH